MTELYEFVINWMFQNDITCGEAIYQSEKVEEKALDFINECFELVKNEMKEDE